MYAKCPVTLKLRMLIVVAKQVIHLGMSSSLLVDMKRKELRYEARQRAKQEAAESKKTS